MMSEYRLVVIDIKVTKLASTNKIYVGPNIANSMKTWWKDEPHLVTIEDIPYMVGIDSKLKDESVALNKMQLHFAKLRLGTIVSLKPLTGPQTPLSSVEVTVTFTSEKAPSKLDTKQLADVLLTLLKEQVVMAGQTVAISFEKTSWKLMVRKCAAVGGSGSGNRKGQVVTLGQVVPSTQFRFKRADGTASFVLAGTNIIEGATPAVFNDVFDFQKLGIGGLDDQIEEILQRAFASRMYPSHIIERMDISHIRGVLLYGPPGCGKTLIARQIGKILNSHAPRIVNGPEILNQFVGGSEEKIRDLFAGAENEQKEAGDQSKLHIIILDEMDAICKQRGTTRDGSGVSDSVVNQFLSKIDGVESLNNILLIGMTNRKDMIDDALLRPGRFEVHVEIGLPDFKGRLQILKIHTRKMRDFDLITPEAWERLPEIAEYCKNFTGAEMCGLVKAASSCAFGRCADVKDPTKAPDTQNLMLQYDDFVRAMGMVEPKFGAKSQHLKEYYQNGFVSYDDAFDELMVSMERYVNIVRTSSKTPLMKVLLHGEAGTGKTALATKMAVDSGFPFVRMVSAGEMIGSSETSKIQMINSAFMDSYKSPLSVILLDDIERLIEYAPIGPRFDNTVLQTLLVLLNKKPQNGSRLLVIGTTSVPCVLEELGLMAAFKIQHSVPLLDQPAQFMKVLRDAADLGEKEAKSIAEAISKPIGIEQLLMVAEMVKQDDSNSPVDVDLLMECLRTAYSNNGV